MQKDPKDAYELLDAEFDTQTITRTVSNNNFKKIEKISKSTSITFFKEEDDFFSSLTPAAKWVARYQQCVDNDCDCYEHVLPDPNQPQNAQSSGETTNQKMNQLMEQMNTIQDDIMKLKQAEEAKNQSK